MRLLRSPLLPALLALCLLACDSDTERPGAATGTASASSGEGPGGSGASTGGAGGSGAAASSSGGAGGSASGGTGGAGVVEYRAVNLITGVPRFVLTKKDTGRDLCFQLRVIMTAGDSATFEQPGPPFEELLAVQGAAECGEVGDPAPVPPPSLIAPASDADGDIGLSQPPCTVTASFTLAFDDPQPWVPASEAFDVQALPVEQGCP